MKSSERGSQRHLEAAHRIDGGLLSADEIRAVRVLRAETQGELVKLLRLGGSTVSRWESGPNAQSAAMGRLATAHPRSAGHSIAYLREHAA